MQFIDANIFIRVLAKDDLIKSQKCFNLFKKAELGSIELHTSESIVAEVVYVLESKRLYNVERKIIAKSLSTILKIRGLKIPHKSIIIPALELYSQNNIDFEDAVLISYTLNSKSNEIYSYDKDISKVEGIKRLEP